MRRMAWTRAVKASRSTRCVRLLKNPSIPASKVVCRRSRNSRRNSLEAAANSVVVVPDGADQDRKYLIAMPTAGTASVEYHTCGRARHNERASDDKEFVFHRRNLRRRRMRQYLDID